MFVFGNLIFFSFCYQKPFNKIDFVWNKTVFKNSFPSKHKMAFPPTKIAHIFPPSKNYTFCSFRNGCACLGLMWLMHFQASGHTSKPRRKNRFSFATFTFGRKRCKIRKFYKVRKRTRNYQNPSQKNRFSFPRFYPSS